MSICDATPVDQHMMKQRVREGWIEDTVFHRVELILVADISGRSFCRSMKGRLLWLPSPVSFSLPLALLLSSPPLVSSPYLRVHTTHTTLLYQYIHTWLQDSKGHMLAPMHPQGKYSRSNVYVRNAEGHPPS